MSRELLKAWVHWALENPIDDDQLAHAEATKELLEENAQLKEEKEQWEPQWFSEAEANAAGYNEALGEIKMLQAENARYREALEFYADNSNTVYVVEGDYEINYCEGYASDPISRFLNDKGKRAREALKGGE